MQESNKKLLFYFVYLLALLNLLAVGYKFFFNTDNSANAPTQEPSPFQRVEPMPLPDNPNEQYGNAKTRPFVIGPDTPAEKEYGSVYENPQQPLNVPTQDYSSWSVDWEKSRENDR